MAKVKGERNNDFCPQALYLYGTYREDGTPNFGLFCWFSYLWDQGLGAMACIGEDKLTKDLIRRNGAFSANLVTEDLLPLADYYGNTPGHSKDKMKRQPAVEAGQVLSVPTIVESPVSFELEPYQEIPLSQGSDLFLCRIRNVMREENLTDRGEDFAARLRRAAPVVTVGEQHYCSLDGRDLGRWGGPMGRLQERKEEKPC